MKKITYIKGGKDLYKSANTVFSIPPWEMIEGWARTKDTSKINDWRAATEMGPNVLADVGGLYLQIETYTSGRVVRVYKDKSVNIIFPGGSIQAAYNVLKRYSPKDTLRVVLDDGVYRHVHKVVQYLQPVLEPTTWYEIYSNEEDDTYLEVLSSEDGHRFDSVLSKMEVGQYMEVSQEWPTNPLKDIVVNKVIKTSPTTKEGYHGDYKEVGGWRLVEKISDGCGSWYEELLYPHEHVNPFYALVEFEGKKIPLPMFFKWSNYHGQIRGSVLTSDSSKYMGKILFPKEIFEWVKAHAIR